VKVGRPFNVYGPGQRLDDGRILPDLISRVLEGKPLVLYSDGRSTRSFCYVRDAVRFMLEILLSGTSGEAFNLGNDREEISIGALAELMSEVAAPPALPIEYQVSEDPHYLTDNPKRRCPNIAKLRALGVPEPKVALREGLMRTILSYREERGA
jgi:dTDP-glucose 4,6-dehydratase/UDP-glucuronate decarboxylase